MMRVDSGGGPSPEDGLHQLFRHYLLRSGKRPLTPTFGMRSAFKSILVDDRVISFSTAGAGDDDGKMIIRN